MNWDTIKLFLALYRNGSARAVAEANLLSPSTVTRRISDLEKQLGVKLFARLSSGFQITESGMELLKVALRMESDAFEIERKLTAKKTVMQGAIKITIPYHLMTTPFMRCLNSFTDQHPKVELEVIPSWERFKLDRGEADMAIRLMVKDTPPPEDLIGVKLAEIYSAIYGSVEYVARHDLVRKGADAKSGQFIGWDDETPYPDWVKNSAFPQIPARHHFMDPLMQVYAAKAGIGLAMLPCFLCDQEADLVRVPADEKWHRFDIWLLSHPDLRETIRFRELRRHIRDYFADTRALWMGEGAIST